MVNLSPYKLMFNTHMTHFSNTNLQALINHDSWNSPSEPAPDFHFLNNVYFDIIYVQALS
jgi:hypothetical protein